MKQAAQWAACFSFGQRGQLAIPVSEPPLLLNRIMPGSTYGQLFRISTFGESHGPAIGVVIDGCPAGLALDESVIATQLARRRPGQSHLSTARNEADQPQILSGVFEGKTTGAPIAILINNDDARSKDYEYLREAYRPGHADYTWQEKYGIRDHRGGGRSSARETAARVAAGAVAMQLLAQAGIKITAWVDQVGRIRLEVPVDHLDFTEIESNPVRCPDAATAAAMQQAIEQVKKEGDSVGGAISCLITGCPPGLGEPVFDKLHAELGKALLSINAVKGFEIGEGFAAASMRGSQHNDAFVPGPGGIATATNHSGGVLGGISNGQPIYCRVAFKPVATIMQAQDSVNQQGQAISLQNRGRHDPCVVPRAVPIVEAMAALVLADFWLRQKASRL